MRHQSLSIMYLFKFLLVALIEVSVFQVGKGTTKRKPMAEDRVVAGCT